MSSLRNTTRILPLLLAALIGLASPAAGDVTRPEPEAPLLATTYAGDEYLKYDISWMGLIKAGELVMEIKPLDAAKERFLVKVTAKSAGLLAFFYPVRDYFEIVVQGRERLPVRMTMEQNEGSRQGRRITVYNQKGGEVTYSKDGRPPEIFPVTGPVHNEFTSFLIMRALPLRAGESVTVPTFADRKRHEVKVLVEQGAASESVLGQVETMKVEPQLNFAGLYQKVGNPEIWLTADQNRIPIRIEAKIKIGSLTAELSEYRRQGAPLPNGSG
ncbi:MAG: DUF3108 domain-containing protein [Desulfobacteraceae bacterium]|nr:DUF3108 domain-containing protein [Desulfobacteraceae bacterium]